jgi:hypothetical protein
MLGHAFADAHSRRYFIGASSIRKHLQGLKFIPVQFSHLNFVAHHDTTVDERDRDWSRQMGETGENFTGVPAAVAQC